MAVSFPEPAMYLNVPSCLVNSTDSGRANQPVSPVRSSIPIVPLSGGEWKAPVLRSRPVAYRDVPRPPDIAAMRERRDASQISVRTLQRERGVEPAAKSGAELHAGMLDAYGYGPLADGLMWLSRAGMDGLQRVAHGLQQLRLGPPACDAAAMPDEGLSVDAFRRRFSADFEIKLSPAAHKAADMRGTFIVLGEDHIDAQIQALLKKVMRDFSRERGDRFFKEGNSEEVCDRRIRSYKLQDGDCQLLESDSVAAMEGPQFPKDFEQKIKGCIDYLRPYLSPRQLSNLGNSRPSEVIEFIAKQIEHLPRAALPGLAVLMKRLREEGGQAAMAMLTGWTAERDTHMAARIRTQATATGVNYVIVGAAHLRGLYERMKDLPCIFMLPKSIADSEPVYRQDCERKAEL